MLLGCATAGPGRQALLKRLKLVVENADQCPCTAMHAAFASLCIFQTEEEASNIYACAGQEPAWQAQESCGQAWLQVEGGMHEGQRRNLSSWCHALPHRHVELLCQLVQACR